MTTTGPSQSSPSSKLDPVLLNTLRYTISAKEYNTLHDYLITRCPRPVRRRAPPPSKYAAIVKSKDEYNAATFRASLRVFVATQAGLKLWDIVSTQVLRRGKISRRTPPTATLSSPNFRLSLSVSMILLLHRLLHRFFVRLRSNLLTKDAAPFRRRNPRISKTLTSRLAPAIGASLAGFALGVYPGDQLRITIAIYIATRAIEFAYNALEDEGWFKGWPWWFGSWMLMPPVFGQLLHAAVFDRDCFPKSYGDFILEHTPNYIQRRPPGYPTHLAWPGHDQVYDSLGEMARLSWPPFISPILFPSASQTLPPSLTAISPVTSAAHPSITSLSCAFLHPSDPSCLRTYITYFPKAIMDFARYFTLFFGLLSLPRYRSFLQDPSKHFNHLAKRILQTTLFLSGAIGTSWGSICLWHYLLPRTFLPTQRWFWGGFLSGFWAFLNRKGGRNEFMYSARLSIDSLWKVGVKRGWWNEGKNRDVWVFVAGLMLLNTVYEVNPSAVSSGVVRRTLEMLRGEGFVDRGKTMKDVEEE